MKKEYKTESEKETKLGKIKISTKKEKIDTDKKWIIEKIPPKPTEIKIFDKGGVEISKKLGVSEAFRGKKIDWSKHVEFKFKSKILGRIFYLVILALFILIIWFIFFRK